MCVRTLLTVQGLNQHFPRVPPGGNGLWGGFSPFPETVSTLLHLHRQGSSREHLTTPECPGTGFLQHEIKQIFKGKEREQNFPPSEATGPPFSSLHCDSSRNGCYSQSLCVCAYECIQ